MAKNLTQHWDTLDTYDRERSQLIQLRHFLSNKVLPFSKHYGRMFENLRVDPLDIRSFEDWSEIPFTTKVDLLPGEGDTSSVDDFTLVPNEEVLGRQIQVVRRGFTKGRKRTKAELGEEFRPVMMTNTADRTTDPVPFIYTRHDIRNLRKAGGRIMLLSQSQQDYRHLNMFPYGPHLAFWQTHYSAIENDAFMMSSGGGKTIGIEGNVEMAITINPEVLIGPPAFLYHVLQIALDEGGNLTRLKTIVPGGGKAPQGLRGKLRHLARELGSGSIKIISTYGLTEAKMAFPECPAPEDSATGSGFHISPDLGLIEIVDPETGKLLGENEPGEIVFTPLDSRGTVVLRYRTGDLIEHGLTYRKCEFCGRSLPRLLGKVSRINETFAVKNTYVNFNELECILDDFNGLGPWQIELRNRNDDPDQVDELLVHTSSNGSIDRDELMTRIKNRFVEVSNVKPDEIRFHSPAELRKLQGVGRKTDLQRLVDNREKQKI